MSESGAGECILCGAFDDYCMVGVHEDIDCRVVVANIKQANKLSAHYKSAIERIVAGKGIPQVTARFALENEGEINA